MVDKNIQEKTTKLILSKEIFGKNLPGELCELIKKDFLRLILAENKDKKDDFFILKARYMHNAAAVICKMIRVVVAEKGVFSNFLFFNNQTHEIIEEMDVSPRLWLSIVKNLLDEKFALFEDSLKDKVFNLRTLCLPKDYDKLSMVLPQKFIDEFKNSLFESLENSFKKFSEILPSMVRNYSNPGDADFIKSSAVVSFKDLQFVMENDDKQLFEEKKQCKSDICNVKSLRETKPFDKAESKQKACAQSQAKKAVMSRFVNAFETLIRTLRFQPSNLQPENYRKIMDFMNTYTDVSSSADEWDNKICELRLKNINVNNYRMVFNELLENIETARNLYRGDVDFSLLY